MCRAAQFDIVKQIQTGDCEVVGQRGKRPPAPLAHCPADSPASCLVSLGRLLIVVIDGSAPFISSPRTIMSATPSASTSHSNFLSVFDAALENYKYRTKEDLSSHPLLPDIQSCDSPEAIVAILREKIPAFSQSQNNDDGLTKWVAPTVNVLCSFSATLGAGIGLVGIRIFLRQEFRLSILFSGFPSSEHNFYGHWCSFLS